jgi:hypothetical protein
MCTTETIRRLYCDGEFEAGQNLGAHKKLVSDTETRLQEILGKMRFLVERYIAANTPRERNPVECVRGFSLGSSHAIDWRIGSSKRVQWLFRDPSYPKFPDKKVHEWSYAEHITCNDALDHDWIDIKVEAPRGSGYLAGPTSQLHRKPTTPKTRTAGEIATASLRNDNIPRRYFEVSKQVLNWRKKKREQASMEIPAKNNKEASTLATSNCERLVAAKEVSMASHGCQVDFESSKVLAPPILSNVTQYQVFVDNDNKGSWGGASFRPGNNHLELSRVEQVPGSSRQNPIDLTDDGQVASAKPRPRKKHRRVTSEYQLPSLALV